MARKTILVTSFKGGVGKSTIAANLSYFLASFSHKVLLIDFDYGTHSLDLILGISDRVLLDLGDLTAKSVAPADIILKDVCVPNLFFCAAPHVPSSTFTPASLQQAIEACADAVQAEYVIIDTPGTPFFAESASTPLTMIAPLAQEALIVSTHHETAIRAADRTGEALVDLGVLRQKLIINCFDCKLAAAGVLPTITEIIDRTHTPLIGVVPRDNDLEQYQDEGLLAADLHACNVQRAFMNITHRVLGENVPLLQGFRGISRKKLIQ